MAIFATIKAYLKNVQSNILTTPLHNIAKNFRRGPSMPSYSQANAHNFFNIRAIWLISSQIIYGICTLEHAIILRIPITVDKLLKMSMIYWDDPRIKQYAPNRCLCIKVANSIDHWVEDCRDVTKAGGRGDMYKEWKLL